MPLTKTFWYKDCRLIHWAAALTLVLVLLLAAPRDLAASTLEQPAPPPMPDSAITTTQPLAAGLAHTCSILESGDVMCWGENADGQLGDGSMARRNRPVKVRNLVEGVTAIGAGDEFTCALMVGGTVSCWGNNADGQLGDGSGGDSTSPVMVAGLEGTVTEIAVGGSHACALTESGGVSCWGRNHAGQAGGSETHFSATALTELSSGVTAIAAGMSHTCALTEIQEVLCWGDNFAGQLGDGSTTERSTPAPVLGLNEGITAIDAGAHHTCALDSAGSVRCWGDNWHGKLGDGSEDDRQSAVAVEGLLGNVTHIVAGQDHACALIEMDTLTDTVTDTVADTVAEEVQCWGDNSYGQIGNDDQRMKVMQPEAVVEVAGGVTAIAAGGTHTCILNETDDLQCWGRNNFGQLGNGTYTGGHTPVAVSGLKPSVTLLKSIAAGAEYTCALSMASEIFCWGRNYTGQLGDGTTEDQNIPVEAAGVEGEIAAITAGWGHTCLLTKEGSVHCWGANDVGQLGMGSNYDHSEPVDVQYLADPSTDIAASGNHTCALSESGGLFCWGANTSGQLGDGSRTNRTRPVAVEGLESGIVAVAGGWTHTCALSESGGVLCWGDNKGGQLGDGTMTDHPSPVAVAGLESGVTAIAAGSWHNCALMESGDVLCWGRNVSGQLGDGTYDDSSVPVEVSGLSSGIAAITAGANHTCALTRTGAVQCWGSNDFGELGNNEWPDPARPVDVVGMNGGVTAIAAGWQHTCALIGLVKIQCWGHNAGGQLGDGNFTKRGIPISVSGLNPGITALAGGYSHTCALNEEGSVQCWGDNEVKQLGNDSTVGGGTPVTVTGLSKISAIAAGDGYSCALSVGVQCWGTNYYGELGNGVPSDPTLAVAVNAMVAKAIATGSFHACALGTTGVVYCWGSNVYGQVGDENVGQDNYNPTPFEVKGLGDDLVAISAGMFHSCALSNAGTVQCWGDNEFGQLGNGTSGPENYSAGPVPVQGLESKVIAIASAGDFTCALSEEGGVSCWGRNEDGQLGDGTHITRATAVQVRRLESGVVAIAAGLLHACALTEAGSVQCWGNNDFGQLQLGDGTELGRPSPVTVEDLVSNVVAIDAGGFHTCVLAQSGIVQCWGNNWFGQLGGTAAWVPVAVQLP